VKTAPDGRRSRFWWLVAVAASYGAAAPPPPPPADDPPVSEDFSVAFSADFSPSLASEEAPPLDSVGAPVPDGDSSFLASVPSLVSAVVFVGVVLVDVVSEAARSADVSVGGVMFGVLFGGVSL